MATYLEQLKDYGVVVADTGDFEAMKRFRPRDATTNPTLLATAAAMPAYRGLVDRALERARARGGNRQEVSRFAAQCLSIEFGLELLKIVPGRVSTEVDARLSFDTPGSMAKARELIGMYEERGITRQRVLIKLASTWEGIRAAEVLEREGIHCNLTLLFGFHQGVACAEAMVTLVSPFVGRILDWYLKSTGRASFPPPEDPGVLSVTRVYNYFKRHGYKTEVMAASFRNVGQITELAGCDLLTISPQLLSELDARTGKLERKLDPGRAKSLGADKLHIDRATFDRMHAEDKMASDKLREGIEGFSQSLAALEKALEARV